MVQIADMSDPATFATFTRRELLHILIVTSVVDICPLEKSLLGGTEREAEGIQYPEHVHRPACISFSATRGLTTLPCCYWMSTAVNVIPVEIKRERDRERRTAKMHGHVHA